jgi:TRAP-type C4-dicarboxylate transport system permease small subunit
MAPDMLQRYSRLMDALYWACMAIAGVCLVVITLIIPWGVFTRYVLNSAASWPEPMAILLMIVFSFLSAAVCYRDSLHIGVVIVPMMLTGTARTAIGWLVELCMIGTNLFMLWWGVKLVATTWHQVIADFPLLSVGITYLPIPVGGAITALFVIERLWRGNLFEQPSAQAVSHIATE